MPSTAGGGVTPLEDPLFGTGHQEHGVVHNYGCRSSILRVYVCVSVCVLTVSICRPGIDK